MYNGIYNNGYRKLTENCTPPHTFGAKLKEKKSLIFRLSGTFYSFVPKLLPKEKKEKRKFLVQYLLLFCSTFFILFAAAALQNKYLHDSLPGEWSPLNGGGSGEDPICDTLRSSGMDLL